MIELIRKRRSTRKFTSEPINSKTRDILIEALLRSPTSRNINPWEFIVVDDSLLLKKLSFTKQYGASLLQGAPLGIVVCADSTKSDVWIEDCSIASILLQMTALSLGLGSCWVQIRKRQYCDEVSSESYIREQLNLPQHMAVLSIIAIGHPDEKRSPIAAGKLNYSKVYFNKYSH